MLRAAACSLMIIFRDVRSFTAAALAVKYKHGTAAVPKPDLWQKFIVVPEHKLLFCVMEKVAGTDFNDLFRRVRAQYDPAQLQGLPWGKNSPQVHGLNKTDLSSMLRNKSWHKAVFYRDPVERFASAWASKCGHADVDGIEHCKKQFNDPDINFTNAISWLRRYDAAFESPASAPDDDFDVHFRRAGDFCGGIATTLQHYDTVEQLDIDSANAKVSRLLQAVGVNSSSIDGFDTLFPPNSTVAYGDDGIFGSEPHYTDARDSLSTYFEGDTSREMLHALVEHYRPDYELFGMPLPSIGVQRIQVAEEAR